MGRDLELLTRWRDGDLASGDRLFKAYFDALYRFFATKCDEPEELVQATFLELVRSRDRFAGRSSLRTYIYQIARHVLLRHLRSLQRARQFDPEVSSIAEIVTTPVARLARADEHRRLLAALRTLPVEQQMLLELHYWEQLDPAGLAEVLDSTPGAIRTRLTRARAALRAHMDLTTDAPASDVCTELAYGPPRWLATDREP